MSLYDTPHVIFCLSAGNCGIHPWRNSYLCWQLDPSYRIERRQLMAYLNIVCHEIRMRIIFMREERAGIRSRIQTQSVFRKVVDSAMQG